MKENSRVLDLCAAPGGKSVYLAQLVGCVPIACDIHEHRLNLIRSYANRMGVKVDAVENDACVFREDWSEKFDCVICDVPCSGSGDLRSKPDILLRRDAASVDELSKLQAKILRCASRYVKAGGKLCYSTCSILREENENVVESFLAHNSDYKTVDCSRFGTETAVEGAMLSDKNDGFVRLFPHTHATDGFFVAVMKKCGKGDIP